MLKTTEETVENEYVKTQRNPPLVAETNVMIAKKFLTQRQT